MQRKLKKIADYENQSKLPIVKNKLHLPKQKQLAYSKQFLLSHLYGLTTLITMFVNQSSPPQIYFNLKYLLYN